eukprot:gene9981-10135_t
MLENSLDAGAKHITVVVKEGGLKYLQIQDDGCGIRIEDLPILCHRHTTSKLRAYEDLDTIATLGFRGEALSSISYVSHVTVTTMTASMLHGYRVQYSDGGMLPPGPKPVAAVPGTSIIVEDMFYNMLPRRRAFKPGPEEHNLLLDVVQRYAIYKAGSVGFTLKRQGEARSDLHTLPSASRLDVIRMLFGPDLAANLLPLQLSAGSGDVSEAVQLDGPMAFTAAGFVSNLTHVGRKSVLILFINGRPVEQGQLKRAIEAVYTAQNPKASKPWVFLDLKMPPRHVEVNVHPTKKEASAAALTSAAAPVPTRRRTAAGRACTPGAAEGLPPGSVRELLAEVHAAAHCELEQVLRNHTWVGMADDRLALLQHSTQLYLVDVGALSKDLFYQMLLTRWQSCQVMQLAQPLPVQQLMTAALQLEEAAGRWQAGPGASKQELCGLVEALLAQKAEMLAEDVDWDSEKECFRSLADVDCQQNPDSNGTSNGKQVGMTSPPAVAGVMGPHRDQQQREWLLRHVLMPAIKYMYKPPRERARDGSVLLLTSMQKLYRVFERCGW